MVRPKVPRRMTERERLALDRITNNYKISMHHAQGISRLCRTHNKDITKIPSWLFGKSLRRVEYWFKTGE